VLLNYHIGRLVLGSLCVRLGNSTTQSQAPDNGYINVRNIIIIIFIYLLQLGCKPVAVVILHVNKT